MSHICRTCLEEIDDNNRLSLDGDVDGLKAQLVECVPELDLDLIPNAYLCVYCARVLQNSYDFKQRCLHSEEIIREHMKDRILPDLDIIKSDFRPHDELYNVDSLDTGMEVVYIHENLDGDDVDSFLADNNEEEEEEEEKTSPLEPLNADDEPATEVRKSKSRPPSINRIKSEEQKLYTHVTYASRKKVEESFDCTKCDFKTSRSFLLKQHLTTHAMTEANGSTRAKVRMGHNGIKEYVCDLCSFKTRKKMRLHKHKRSYNHASFTCKVCLFKSKSPFGLRSHLKTHKPSADKNLKITIKVPNGGVENRTEDLLKCVECMYVTPSLKKFKKHQKKHDIEDVRVYKCATCRYETKDPVLLREHNSIHVGQDSALYPCPECPLVEQYKSKLKVHFVRHLGDRQFKCHLCTYNVHTFHALKKHLLLHQKR